MQIKLMGTRERAVELDFSGVPLEEEVETTLKDAAKISMGTEVSEEDMLNIMELCDQARPLMMDRKGLELFYIKVPLSCRSLRWRSTGGSCMSTSSCAWRRSRPT